MIVRKETNTALEDVQNRTDERSIYINEVGISELRIPLTVQGCEKDKKKSQQVTATLSISVDLAADRKGIHMSRLLETILDHPYITLENVSELLNSIAERQNSTFSSIVINFDYFFIRKAPVTNKSFPQSYRCIYKGQKNQRNIILSQEARVPVQTLCPCSKEISDYGAHNQRSVISITLYHLINRENNVINVTLEEIINVAERSASSPLYPILKREDERHITMKSYDNPCFVEDVVRNASSILEADFTTTFTSYKVKAVNYESIHNHNAFAVVSKLDEDL